MVRSSDREEASQNFRIPAPPEAISDPSGLKAQASTALAWRSSRPTSSPVTALQSGRVPSQLAPITYSPSGEKSQSRTKLSPTSVRRRSPLSSSQTRTVLSSLHAASQAPSGEKAKPGWPSKRPSSSLPVAVHNPRLPPPTESRPRPSGLNTHGPSGRLGPPRPGRNSPP